MEKMRKKNSEALSSSSFFLIEIGRVEGFAKRRKRRK